MILHFLIHSQGTEKQFAAYVLQQFSDPEMCSDFVVMSSDDEVMDYDSYPRVRIVNPEHEDEMVSLVDSLSSYSAIIFHGLFEPWCEAVLQRAPESIKIAWVCWGGEIYGRRDLVNSYLAPRSRAIGGIRNTLKGIRGKRETHYEIPKNLYQRIDYCLTDMEEEYAFVKEYLDNPRMKFHWYNYYSIEKTLGELADHCCSGDNIILGNSATIECNYFDALPIIKRHLRDDSSVIVPLGYGAPWVRNLVLKYGRYVLGDRFDPLVAFMSRGDYNKALLSCSTMVQPHFRPQAQGNIITGLWLGMSVFLSEKNLAYQYFKRIGVELYSIEKDLDKSLKSCLPMNEASVEKNRSVLSHWYGKNEMRSRIIDLVSVLEQ